MLCLLPQTFDLKLGAPITLVRNLDPTKFYIYSGTRLIMKKMMQYVRGITMPSGRRKEDNVITLRIRLLSITLPEYSKMVLFLFVLSFVMSKDIYYY